MPKPLRVGPLIPGERITQSPVNYLPRERFPSDQAHEEHRADLSWYHNQREPYVLGARNQYAFDIRVRDSLACPRPAAQRVEIDYTWDQYPGDIFPVWRSSALDDGLSPETRNYDIRI